MTLEVFYYHPVAVSGFFLHLEDIDEAKDYLAPQPSLDGFAILFVQCYIKYVIFCGPHQI